MYCIHQLFINNNFPLHQFYIWSFIIITILSAIYCILLKLCAKSGIATFIFNWLSLCIGSNQFLNFINFIHPIHEKINRKFIFNTFSQIHFFHLPSSDLVKNFICNGYVLDLLIFSAILVSVY